MDYNYIKSLHLIFVITWFAGLFYIVRLFVYHIEANSKPSPEKEILTKQYKLMSYRLWYIITWPSAVLASIFAYWMIFFTPTGQAWLTQPWMHVKLCFVLLLYLYHLKCHQIFKELQNDTVKHTTNFMRLWNEGATLILFAVVFLVILKSAVNWIYGVVGIMAFSILIMLGFKFYKKIRERNDKLLKEDNIIRQRQFTLTEKAMIEKYQLDFYKAEDGRKSFTVINRFLGSAMNINNSIDDVNKLLGLVNGVLQGKTEGIELPTQSLEMIIILPEETKIYDLDAWEADNTITPDYVLPTADFKIIVEIWIDYLKG